MIFHSGVGHDDNPPGRGSGRYAYGSGKNPGQHQFDFLSRVSELEKKGLKESEIAKMLLGEKAKTTDLRAEITIEKNKRKQISIAEGQEMLNLCNGNMSQAARRLGYKNESSLRSLLDPVKKERRTRYENTADMLREVVDKKGYVDISKDSNIYLNVPKYTMDVAVSLLEKEGYLKSWVKVPQMGTTNETSVTVLAKKGATHSDVQKNKFNIQPIVEFSPDSGKTWWTPEFPESLSSKRIKIRYAEDGGSEKDGVIELRPGVEDISLGGSRYSQVRIAVDGTNYMKGMAIYSEDIPKGYDVIYNTNKSRGTPAIDKSSRYVLNEDTGKYEWTGKEVLKRMNVNPKTMEVDKDNPFGASIRLPKEIDGILTAGGQRHYIDEKGKDKLSPINKLQDEGDWSRWSKNLSSQFLSKQSVQLIKQQVDSTILDKKIELERIKELTNPVIKKKLLDQYASDCDANATSLSARGFKRQAFQVFIPIPDMKDTEVYAPNYKHGEQVAIIRFPHGGLFEIPILKVNNRQKTAVQILGKTPKDAIGFNKNIADQLSGADFDGDSGLVIPLSTTKMGINFRKQLEELKGFDPKVFKLPDSAPRIDNSTKQREMGKVSNLITDMTLQNASFKKIARAVKHSMVVIDSEKHHLDYKRSEKVYGIRELKREYQGRYNEETGRINTGASTIISRAKSPVRVPKRKEVTDVTKMSPSQKKAYVNGERVFVDTGETIKRRITDPSKMTSEELKLYNSGKKVYRDTGELKTEELHAMDVVKDATKLVRNTKDPKEMEYARLANSLKDLANEARREYRAIKPIPVNRSSAEIYKKEVSSLKAKLRIAKSNNPKERRAQMIANAMVSERFKDNPDMDYEHRQRERASALNKARVITGAKKERIEITDKEWEAIQANAISTSRLTDIVNNTDIDSFKKRATPRNDSKTLSKTQINLIRSMISSGNYTSEEIASRLGISTSTVSKYAK